MSGHGQKLTRKEELAVVCLLTQPTIIAAAEKTGVSEATLNRWMKREEFKEAFREARRHAVSQVVARLHQACAAAVATLVSVMADALGMNRWYMSRLLRLTLLAPDIVEAIVDRQEPDGFSLNKFVGTIPEIWEKQRREYGFERQG